MTRKFWIFLFDVNEENFIPYENNRNIRQEYLFLNVDFETSAFRHTRSLKSNVILEFDSIECVCVEL